MRNQVDTNHNVNIVRACPQPRSSAVFLSLIACIVSITILVLKQLWRVRQRSAMVKRIGGDTDHVKISYGVDDTVTTSNDHNLGNMDQDVEISNFASQMDSPPMWARQLHSNTIAILVAELFCDAAQVVIYTIIVLHRCIPTIQPPMAVASRAYGLSMCLVTLACAWGRKQFSTELWLLRPFLYGSLLVEGVSQWLTDHTDQNGPHAPKLQVADLVLVLISLILSINVRKRGNALSHENRWTMQLSPESYATVFSASCFGWMNPLMWQDSEKSYEVSNLYRFSTATKALVILRLYRRQNHQVSLARNLIRFTGSFLLLQAFWAILSALLTFAPVLFFREILSYVEQPNETSVRSVWAYVCLLLALGIGKSLADGQAAWMGIQCYVRARGVLAGEIFSKVLQRSLIDSFEKSSDEDDGLRIGSPTQFTLSNGHVTNLLSTDTLNIAEMGNSFYLLWVVVPIELIVGMILLYQILGYSALIGLAVMVTLIPVNNLLAGRMSKMQKRVMAFQSDRISRVEETLLGIRTIKFQAWEALFRSKIDQARERELNCRTRAFAVQSLMVAVYNTAPLLISIVSFSCYTLIAHKELRASIAFPALSLFALIRGPLDKFADVLSKVIQARLSVGRIETFLQQPNKPPGSPFFIQSSSDHVVTLRNRSFTWNSHGDQQQFSLQIPEIILQKNKLNLITGPTASGKSTFLLALLGEMYSETPSDHSNHLFVAPSGLEISSQAVRIAYCAQEAWLINDTIRKNILFGSVFNAGRYEQVIACCSLDKDLDNLPYGDSTLVGEKGVTLSGGQKQRVSLARALYSNANILLLDDCLSAVDTETSRWIFRKAIKGPLSANRTCVMITHNIDLSVENSDHVIVLRNGRVAVQGSPLSIRSEVELTNSLKDIDFSVDAKQSDESKEPTAWKERRNGQTEDIDAGRLQNLEYRNLGAIKFSLFSFYFSRMGSWLYWTTTVAVLLLNQLSDIANSLWVRQWANAYRNSIWNLSVHTIKRLRTHSFANSSPTVNNAVRDSHTVNVGYYLRIYTLLILLVFFIKVVRMQVLFRGLIFASQKIHSQLLDAIIGAKLSFFDRTPYGRILNRMTRDVKVIDTELALVMLGLQHAALSAVAIWIIIAAVTPLFILPSIIVVISYFYLARYFLRSSWEFKRLESIQYSPIFQHLGEALSGFVTIRAYGQQERFLQNFAHAVDEHTRAYMHLWAANIWLTLRVEALSSFVGFLSAAFIVFNANNVDPGAAGLALTYSVTFTEYVLWFVRCYSMTQQNMNSVERVEEYVSLPQEEVQAVQDENVFESQQYRWPSQGHIVFSNFWLKYADHLPFVLKNIQLDIQGGQKVAIVGRTGAGKSSLSLALLRAVDASSGSISIDDIDISSLPLKKLRSAISYISQDPTVFPGSLRVNLDPFGEYTDEELLQVLRQLTFISSEASAQDLSVLSTFLTDSSGNSGDERTSSGKSNDKTPKHNATNIDSNDANEAQGGNIGDIPTKKTTLSSGQKQLICLARALLKRPRILIMDEATASIDYETDAKIQKVLRQDLAYHHADNSPQTKVMDRSTQSYTKFGTTVITIAHRLRTIIDYDRVIVLDRGEIIEDGEPWALLRRETSAQKHSSNSIDNNSGASSSSRIGAFASMCRQTGHFEELRALAKEAWEGRRRERTSREV